MKGKDSEAERIAVMNLNAISEVILAIPATRALNEHYPDAKLTMIVNAQAKDVAEMNPYVEDVIAYDSAGEHQGFSGFLSFLSAVRAGSFDMAIILDLSLRSPLIAWAAGIKYRLGYDYKFRKIFLTDMAELPKRRIQHQTINYLQVLKPLAVTTADTSLKLTLDDTTEKIVDVTMFLNTERPNVIFCPVNLNRKNVSLGEEKALKIICELERFSNVYLLGGIKEQQLLTALAEASALPRERVLAGKLNLKETAVWISHASLMLSVETCALYMAQALAVPVVALFGPSSPLVYGPCGNRDATLLYKLPCMPCGCAQECPHQRCMEEIPVQDIIEKVAERVQRNS